MLEITIKGIIIGLFISIPLGPIGMLCIQRTLNRGRKYGIATGLGATTSDLFYTLITLFFLSFVIDIIEQNRSIIQISGSIILIVFGYFIYSSHPSRQPRPNEKSNHSLLSDYFSSLGLTITNPLVLFVLIALFARFEFLNDVQFLWEYLLAIFSILLGAFLWWSMLTFMVSRFRSKLNMRGLKFINHITGVIIMVIGVAGIVISMT